MNRTKLCTALLLLPMLAGCNHKQAPAGSTSYTQAAIQAGGTLNSDGSVTNPNGSITQPNGTATPPPNTMSGTTSGPAQSTGAPPVNTMSGPAPAPVPPPTPATANSPAPAPVAVTAPAGTAVTIRTTQELSAARDDVGTHFNGVVERPVIVHGATIFARGTPVSGEVVASKRKGTFKGSGDLAITLTAIGHDSVHTSEYVQVDKGRGKRTGAFIGGGGGLGAIIGGLAGGGKGALIGGLAGAGAGTAASTTGSKNVVIHSETVITFRLRAPVTR